MYSMEIGNPTFISDPRPHMFVIAANSLAAGSGFWHFNNNLLTKVIILCNNLLFYGSNTYEWVYLMRPMQKKYLTLNGRPPGLPPI